MAAQAPVVDGIDRYLGRKQERHGGGVAAQDHAYPLAVTGQGLKSRQYQGEQHGIAETATGYQDDTARRPPAAAKTCEPVDQVDQSRPRHLMQASARGRRSSWPSIFRAP